MTPFHTRRLAALLGAVLFLLGRTGGVVGMGSCPHHGLAMAAGALHHAAPGMHHPAAGQPGETDPHSGSPSPHRHGGPCTCAGPCHADSVAGPPDPSVYARGPALPLGRRPGPLHAESPRPRLAAFLLPYPTAPPPAV